MWSMADEVGAGPRGARRAIAITTRRPLAGAVKTRLAASIGQAAALHVYRSLLGDAFTAVETVRSTDCFVALLDEPVVSTVAADRAGADDVGRPDAPGASEEDALRELGLVAGRWHLILQRGDHLGERLASLLDDLFARGYSSVALVGGDSPGLPGAYLEQAFTSLAGHRDDAVALGPTADGGFYLIAVGSATWKAHSTVLRRALTEARMGTASARADVAREAARAGLDVETLPLWIDVDDGADLPVFERLTTGAATDGRPGGRKRGALRGEPLDTLRDVYLHVTDRCGLGCPHCYNRADPRLTPELTTEEWRHIIDQCVESGTTSFVIIGGDPFLREDLFDLVAYISGERERKVRIFFNGRCDPSTAALLAQAGHGLVRPLLSVDGSEPVNDLIRGAGNYRDTLDAITNLAAEGLHPVVNTVLLAPVLPTLPALARAVKEAGATQMHLILPHERGAIIENAALIPSGAEMLAAVEDLVATAAEISLTIDNVPAWRRRLLKARDFCTAGCSDIAIDPFGKVYACTITCGDPAFVAGDLRRERLEDVWRRSPALKLLRACRARDRAECAECPVVDACGGECWVQAHYAAVAAGRPAGLRAPFPYCDLIRPLFEAFIDDARRTGWIGPVCGPAGPRATSDGATANSADGGQVAAGEVDYALFDCI
jgi:radical SAM protein with 4Fe4S-binding SPASM domain